ncbi:MAG TPA: DUF11 domain-containing protein [Thermoanaerobaculia bacterium]|nr:DUF11 domain-containing protein [Thermoanaerobaculia bacterium]
MSRLSLVPAAAVLLTLLAGVAPAAGQASADLSVTKVDDPDPVMAGSSLVYTVTVSNEGPDSAGNATFDDPLPAGTTFQSLASPGGWGCTTPAVGANGTVSCSNASFTPGSAVFTIAVTVDAGVANGTVLTNTASVSSTTPDPSPGAESASADTTVTAAATTAVSITKSDSPDPVVAGAGLTYTITASNNGPTDLETATVSDTLPADTAFVSLSSPAGWSCSTPAVGGTGAISCTVSPFAPGDAVFSLVVQVSSSLPGGASVANQARLDVTDSGHSTSQVAMAATQVISPAALSGTKIVSGDFSPGGVVTYTVVLTNGSANTQGDNPGPEFTDVLPSELVLAGATASSGTATATTATNTVTWNGSLAGGASATVTIHATVGAVAAGTTISNHGDVAYDADGDGTNEASSVTDDPGAAGPADPTTFTVQPPPPISEVPVLGRGLGLLALLLAAAGGWKLRRRATAG